METTVWYEIRGFQSPNEYSRFVRYVEDKVKAGVAQEIPPLLSYQKGCLVGGRWFMDAGSGEIWRLIPPDFPFKGVWERVEGA